MNYKEYKPSKELENLIESFWVSNTYQTTVQKILPDGCADIIFNFSDENDFIQKRRIIISGMMTKHIDIKLNSNSSLFGIRFKTGQLSRLTKHPLFEIKDKTVDASEIIKELKFLNLELLAKQTNIKDKINLIENFILTVLSNKKNNSDLITNSVIDLISNSQQKVKIKNIAKYYNISLRQLERKFNTSVGVTLKEFTKIIRFKNTTKYIATNPQKSLLHIAFDNGYYDHSHLTNEFKQIAGKLPTEFRHTRNDLVFRI